MRNPFLVLLLLNVTLGAFARDDSWLNKRCIVDVSFSRYGVADPNKSNAPIPDSFVLPEYPLEMVRAGFTGGVVMDYTVTAEGVVNNIHASSWCHEDMKAAPIFKASVLENLQRRHYQPAVEIESGRPINSYIRCYVRFGIEENKKTPNQAAEPTAPSGRGSP